jgi:hypothetical protein
MTCFNSTVVDAPAAEVWAVLRNFHDCSWTGVVTDLERAGDPFTTGATRVLNGVFFETLVGLDDTAMELRYSIDDGPGPIAKDQVAGYIGAVRVLSVTDTNQSFVTWSSRWESGGEGAAEFCTPIYRALLADLKTHFA